MFLSVIVPAYNAEKYIIRNLMSLSSQNFKDMEVVVVNDGSTDNTKCLVEEFIKQNPSLNINLINIENGGLANARNIGIKNAKGDYFINLDADDFLVDSFVSKIYEKYLETDFDVCMYGYQDFNESNKKFEHPYEETMEYILTVEDGKTMALNKIKRKIWICQGSACYRKTVLEKNNIYNIPGLNQGEDYYFITKFLLFSKKVATIPQIGVSISYREDSMMHSTYNKTYLQVFKLLEKLINDIKSYNFLNDKTAFLDYLFYEYEIHRLAIAKKIIMKYPLLKIKEMYKNIKNDVPEKIDVKKEIMSKSKIIESTLFNHCFIMYVLFVKLYRRIY